MDIKEKIKHFPPDEFFLDEYRGDLFVGEKKKKIWSVQIDLYCELARVCEKYGIRYSVCFGTLLGAVRHKGFIPWDWDIDVYMLRSEYNKLVKIANQEFEYPYFFQNALTDRRFFVFHSMLRNSETTEITPWNCSEEFNGGIYIDIYPLDGYVGNNRKLKVQYLKTKVLAILLRSYYSKKGDLLGIRGILNSIFKKIAPKLIAYEKAFSLFEKEVSKHENQTSEVTWMFAPSLKDIVKYAVNKSDVLDTVKAPFEYIEVFIPRNYDELLKRLYGDYMKFPSKEEIEKQQNLLIMDADISYKQYYDERARSNR